ncbi:relaxase/mobilization nuclease domain-containing protein [Halocynthiibacter styelae]|nr:relaxase/mobilization nuclease domain-containing protein [Paenihalocynthiibacter styelae]
MDADDDHGRAGGEIMILKASHRGGAKALADHLMNERDNDHISCLELRDFSSDDLHGALAEMHAISKATKCRKFMFSLSLNPPQDHVASEQEFLDAADRVEKSLGLEGQPRAIVTHEKEGRRHAHVVWSRIGVEDLKAIHMGRYKLALRDVSRDLFLDHGWELPDGLATYGYKNPLNFTLEEWQQAKRKGLDPREIRQVFQQAWAGSDTQQGFRNALEERGYFLARGDRRGFVALDIDGKPHSIAKWTGLKSREVRAKLESSEDLPSVSEATSTIRTKVTTQMQGYIAQATERQAKDMEPLNDAHAELKQMHREERQKLQAGQEKRWVRETRLRSDRLNTGLRGMFDRLTGAHQAIRKRNEQEALQAARRDQKQRDFMIREQMKERRQLQVQIDRKKQGHRKERQILATNISGMMRMHSPDHPPPHRSPTQDRQRGIDFDIT